MTSTPITEYYPTCSDCGSAAQGRGYFGDPYCGLCERSIDTGDIDHLPGRMRTIAAMLEDQASTDRAWARLNADLDRQFAAVRADLAKPVPVSTANGIVWEPRA